MNQALKKDPESLSEREDTLRQEGEAKSLKKLGASQQSGRFAKMSSLRTLQRMKKNDPRLQTYMATPPPLPSSTLKPGKLSKQVSKRGPKNSQLVNRDVRISAFKGERLKGLRNLSCENLVQRSKMENDSGRKEDSERKKLRDESETPRPDLSKVSSSARGQRSLSDSSSTSSLEGPYQLPSQIHNPIIEACQHVSLPNHEAYRSSTRSNGAIKAYAANTNQGSVRNYNEDRVAIILNIVKPDNHSATSWPKCQYFAIYDGHGGHGCADFLRDNLHNYVVRQSCFPQDVHKAIQDGFAQADFDFLADAEQEPPSAITQDFKPDVQRVKDRSGSCAIVVMFIDKKVYIANVGDSRGIMSMKGGKEVMSLSTDHKPDMEHQRITAAGGKVYQSQTMVQGPTGNQILLGPPRILPGKLSVSRCFGDVEAKREKLGGNPKVLIADPEIFTVDLTDKGVYDFIFIGCDGIFDKLTNVEITKTIWDQARMLVMPNLARSPLFQRQRPAYSIHSICGENVDLILKASVQRKSIDNVTGVFICLKSFKKHMLALKKQADKRALLLNSANGLALKSAQNSPSQSRNFKRNELAQRYASHDVSSKKPATRDNFMPPIAHKTLSKLTPSRKSRLNRPPLLADMSPDLHPSQPSHIPSAPSFIKDQHFKSTGPVLKNQRNVASSHTRKSTHSPPSRNGHTPFESKTYKELRNEAETIFAKITRKNPRPVNLPPPSRTLPSRNRPNSTLTPDAYLLTQNDILSKKNISSVLRKNLPVAPFSIEGNDIFRKSVNVRPGRPPVITGCFSSLKPSQ